MFKNGQSTLANHRITLPYKNFCWVLYPFQQGKLCSYYAKATTVLSEGVYYVLEWHQPMGFIAMDSPKG